MAVPDRNNLPIRTNQTEQYVLNYSFDEVYKILMVGLAAYNATLGTYDRVQMDNANGGLKVSIVGGGSGGGGSARATDAFALAQIDDTTTPTTYEYYGYEDASENWYIKRFDVVNNKFEFVTGSGGGVAAQWATRASKTYASYGLTF